jgi:serine phosphatase RsbU (regulator of sigma subunit)
MIVLLVRRLIYDRQEKRRYATEVESARTVQQLLLSDPVEGIEAVYLPAQEVGGDFHWSRQNADGSILIAVGDVSGKGLKAAMLVSVTIGLLRAGEETSPAEVLAKLNRGLLSSTGGGFVTAAVALIDGSRLRIASAGHPLGIASSAEYAEQEFQTGGQLTFLSDGVIEAANAKGELFGFERTTAIAGKSASEIAEAARAWGQNDDITVVTVRRSR